MVSYVVFLILALAAGQVNAATLAVNSVVYFNGACPGTGFSASSTTGRFLRGDSSTGNVAFGGSALTNMENRAHSHTAGTNSMCMAPTNSPSKQGPCQPFSGTALMKSYTSASFCATGGATQTSTSGMPMIHLNACKTTQTFTVPGDTVVFMEPGTACPPTGFATFTPALSRTLVSATSSLASGWSPTPDGVYLNSPTSAPTHSHTVSGLSVGTKSMTTGCGAVYAPSASVSGSTGDVDPLPGTTAAVCRANDGSSSASDLPAGAHLFFAKTACPSDFEDADTTFNGRLIFGTPSGGTTGTAFGVTSTTLAYATSGTAPQTHTHSGWSTAAAVQVPYTSTYWTTATPTPSTQVLVGFAPSPPSFSPTPVGLTVGPTTSATGATAASIPFTALLLCKKSSSTPSPTRPTNAPTTLAPTLAPTTPAPTPAPTDPPTDSPTTQAPTPAPTDPPTPPTNAPTTPEPTPAPTDPPTTLPPTNAPTDPTSAPTVAPTNPTASPTPPTSPPTLAPTSPTSSPLTSSPTAPTNAPTIGTGSCGFSSNVNFITWLDSVITSSPLLYPANDADLQYILSTASAHGCKVRVVGSGHSEDGVVHQKTETNVVVINLSSYQSPYPWNGQVYAGPPPSIKLSAGASFLDLIAKVRPMGYLLRSQTAGFFFTIGGVVMNPAVHGGALGEGRLNSYIRSLRVMLANGTITEITDPAEVIAWRGSLGLLGVCLGVEFEVKQDLGIKMDLVEKVFDSGTSDRIWNKTNVENHLLYILNTYGSAEYFFNAYDNTVQIEAIDYTGAPGFNYSATKPYYDALLSQFSGDKNLAKTGGQITDTNEIFSTILSTNNLKLLNELVMGIGFTQTKSGWTDNMATRRDAYFVAGDGLVKFDQLYIMLPISTAGGSTSLDPLVFAVLDATRTFLQNVINNATSAWYPSLPLEWRFVDVSSTQTQLLEHLTPGRWMALEIVNSKDATNGLVHAPYFRNLEQLWISICNSFPSCNGTYQIHHGKSWALDYLPGISTPYPFQTDAMLNRVYSSTTKSAFISKMNYYDPAGLFRAGEGMRMLGLSSVKFDPRRGAGGDCSTNGNADCLPLPGETSGCCCNDPILCTIPSWDIEKCTIKRSGKGQKCRVGCECNSGLSCIFHLFTFDFRCA